MDDPSCDLWIMIHNSIFQHTVPASRIMNRMKVLLTGATGFIGSAVVTRLLNADHEVTALVRDVEKARQRLGDMVQIERVVAEDDQLDLLISVSDAVINLAGEPVIGSRWSESRKTALRESRVDLTRRLVESIGRSDSPPSVMVSASAVGYYGDGQETILDENAPAGDGFLAELSRDWENAALQARQSGVRVACPRIGVVLGLGGGALEKMLLPFRLGLGGPVGSGRQYVPWIHLDDVVGMIVTALTNERFDGPFNATSPQPVTFRDFAKTLGGQLGRLAVLPVPGFGLKLLFGEASEVLLAGQRAVPNAASTAGYNFKFVSLKAALADLLSK